MVDADFLFDVLKTPRAVVRVCRVCRHAETVMIGFGGVGRGFGMREGNKARGRMIAHINKNHQHELAKLAEIPLGQRKWPKIGKV